MPLQPEIRVLNTPHELFAAAAAEFVGVAEQAIHNTGRFTVALSGGSTPRNLYSLLASNEVPQLPWDKIYFFFSDERYVPPDHPESNYRMANESLLSKVPLPKQNIFRVPTELADAEAAAKEYERKIRSFFHAQPGEIPGFDLILLGMGPDGHTASLFPGTAALEERNRLVVANWVEKFKSYRITFTLPLLNHAAWIMFIVSGQDKAETVRKVLREGQDLPARRVQPAAGKLIWLLDQAAGSQLG
jgi:6-phosphogluconolactonase